MASDGFAVAAAVVQARAMGTCEGCGRYGGPLDTHHRMPRGMGGVSRQAATRANRPENLIALCRACHEWAETHRVDAQARGWIIPHGRHDPAHIPARLGTVNGRGWWYLNGHGGYDYPTPAEIARLDRDRSVTGYYTPDKETTGDHENQDQQAP